MWIIYLCCGQKCGRELISESNDVGRNTAQKSGSLRATTRRCVQYFGKERISAIKDVSESTVEWDNQIHFRSIATTENGSVVTKRFLALAGDVTCIFPCYFIRERNRKNFKGEKVTFSPLEFHWKISLISPTGDRNRYLEHSSA